MTKSYVQLFGKLKALSPRGIVEVETKKDMTPQDLRIAVARALTLTNPNFGGLNELTSSAIADGSRLLTERETLGDGKEFFLLPPVCGG